MNRHAREVVQVATEQLGFTFSGYDGSGHIVLTLPDGRRSSIPATPSDWRGARNSLAGLERLSGRKVPRPNRKRSHKSFRPSGFSIHGTRTDPEMTARVEELRACHDEQRREWLDLLAHPTRSSACRARALMLEIDATERSLRDLHQPVERIVS